jgi:hypothetical protein
MQVLFYFIVLCWPRVSEPKAAVGAAIHHVGECSRVLMSLSWSVAARRIMSTCAMGVAALGGAIVVAVATIVLVVAVAIVAITIAIVVAVVAIAIVATAIAIVAIAVVAVVVVVVVPHHGGHHILHLGPHGGLSGLEVGFSTLETVGNFSVIINWRWLDTWSLLDRWMRTLFFKNMLQHKIGNGS